LILGLLAAALFTFYQPQQYEITIYSNPIPIQESQYSEIWLNPGETVQGSIYTTKEGEDWFYVHRCNYQSGWLKFEYGKMGLAKDGTVLVE
jgi:hypothetical protein